MHYYTYDPAGRQTSTTAAGRTLTYQYDPAGNRTRLTWPDGYNISTNYAPQSRTANGLNQYTTLNATTITHDPTLNATTITHDPNGNLQSDGVWTYGHDPDNRLVSAVRNNPASSASLGYDPAGRLNHTNINGTVTDLLYDGTDLIAEYDGAGNLATRHIHGPGIDEPLVSITGTTKTWRYADHLGSVIAEADAMGNATAIRGYGPFGENGTTAPNRFGYTGQQYIAGLGLYYYKARWYSPTMGRFLETDPIGYGDGVNWYAYVGNNPVNLVDPDGKLAFFWHAGITYAAARDSGRGFVDSLALAWNTMMVDKGTQSTAAIDANIHAMLGTIKDANGKDIYQTGGQGLQAINGIIANAPLPTAIHTTQDAATPDHYLKPWEGAGFNWDTITHLVHDTFPSVGTITNAYSNTMNVLSKPIAQQGAVK